MKPQQTEIFILPVISTVNVFCRTVVALGVNFKLCFEMYTLQVKHLLVHLFKTRVLSTAINVIDMNSAPYIKLSEEWIIRSKINPSI